jgi:hypothetical protein
MKKNTCILLLVWLIQFSCVCAQTQTIDSLRHLLQNENQDTLRCLLLEQLSSEYEYYKPDTSLRLSEEALALAKKVNFVKGEASGLSQAGYIYSLIGSYDVE